MKPILTRGLYFALPIGFILGSILLVGTGPEGETGKLSESGIPNKAPLDASFAGEKVPTGDFEVNERLDRELIKNIYFHSATILSIKRAGRWKNEITSILKQYGVPEDFFYLCIAESQLSNATSPAGAKGFWQFMEGTAKNYGLVVNDQVDERLDPIKSSHAAAKYLRDSFSKFKNWTLVAASYNMGVGGVESELNRQKVKNYYDLFLNSETAAYVFRVVAIKCILESPDKYGFKLKKDEVYSPIRYRKVKVSQSITSLIDFALSCNTNYKMVRVMNPWLLTEQLIVKPGESWTIQIPFNTDFSAEELMLDAEGLPVPATDSLNQDSLKNDSAK